MNELSVSAAFMGGGAAPGPDQDGRGGEKAGVGERQNLEAKCWCGRGFA